MNIKAQGTQKIVIIGLIAVVIIGILLFFFMGRDSTAGKAIALPLGTFAAGSGGAEEPISLPQESGNIITLNIGAHLPEGRESVGFSTRVDYNPTLLEFVDVDSKLAPDWGTEFMSSTLNSEVGMLRFEHSTLDFTRSIQGPVRLAEVNFRVREDRVFTQENINSLRIVSLDVYDLDAPHGNLITGPLVQPSGVAGCSIPDADAGLCGGFCADNTATYCPPVPAAGGSGYTPDINRDAVVNGQDAFIVLKIVESRIRDECGADGSPPCVFDGGNYICDGGSFRVDGYKGYTYNAADTCPFADMDGYLGG